MRSLTGSVIIVFIQLIRNLQNVIMLVHQPYNFRKSENKEKKF